jgi:hypothetical protein
MWIKDLLEKYIKIESTERASGFPEREFLKKLDT